VALEIYTVYVIALLVMEKGVYTQVEWQPSLIIGSTDRKLSGAMGARLI